MKPTLRIAAGIALIALQAKATVPPQAVAWDDRARWENAVGNVLHFFDQNAWDASSGSYASEIDQKGGRTSDARDVVAVARMIYANAKAPERDRNLARARSNADFLIQKMMARDAIGTYFQSSVDSQGKLPISPREYTFIFEQAYGISGLVALYSEDPSHNPDLLPVIREAARSFWARFEDAPNGGLFYYYNFANKDHSNDQGQEHKSYQSTIYPVSSFLFALSDADPANRGLYNGWIRSLLRLATDKIVEESNGAPTGWLLERFSPAYTTDATYTMSEAGHIHQLAWVLDVAVRKGIVTDAADRVRYLEIAKSLLTGFAAHGGFSPSTGCVYDAFDRTTGNPLQDQNGLKTTAWWSNLEAIIAYSLALRENWYGTEASNALTQKLDGLANCYFHDFVDAQNGGEYFRVNADTGAVVDSTKGGPGKSGYHITETYQYLFGH